MIKVSDVANTTSKAPAMQVLYALSERLARSDIVCVRVASRKPTTPWKIKALPMIASGSSR